MASQRISWLIVQQSAICAGLAMRDRSTVAQVGDPLAAQRDQPIAQIGQMRTTPAFYLRQRASKRRQ